MMNELILEELREAEKLQFDIFMGETTEEEAKKRFRIESTEQANWAFRKLRAINVKSNEIKELAAAERQRIDEWEKKELSVLENSTEFFEGLLAEYFIKQRELDPKFKLSTPYGRVSSRKQQPKWIYDDEKILESLKDKKLDKFIRIKEEVNKVDLKKEVKIFNNVCVKNGQVLGEVKPFDDTSYVDVETGEIYDLVQDDFEIYEQLIVYDGKFIEGIKVEERPDSINIKVVD